MEHSEKFKKETEVMHQTNEQLRESNASLQVEIQRKQDILAGAAKQEEKEGRNRLKKKRVV